MSLENEVIRLRNLLNFKKQSFEFFEGLSKRIDKVEAEAIEIRQEFIRARGKMSLFSPTELKVFRCIKENRGKLQKQMPDIIGMKERTFKFHMSNMLRKAGVSRWYEL